MRYEGKSVLSEDAGYRPSLNAVRASFAGLEYLARINPAVNMKI